MFSHLLISEIFAFILVFSRIGAALMIMPIFGESYVLSRARLFLALTFSIVLTPALKLPPMPPAVPDLFVLILGEVLIGGFIGMLARMLISAIHVAGMIIAYQSSLASALVQDVTQVEGQASALGNFIGLSTLLLFFATDMHHLMLRGIADSYGLFLPGHFPAVGDFSDLASHTLDNSFHMALKLAAPHVVIGIIMYLGAGIIARLMPAIQIFFIMTAPQLLISFFLLMIIFSSIMLWYLEYFRTSFSGFIHP